MFGFWESCTKFELLFLSLKKSTNFLLKFCNKFKESSKCSTSFSSFQTYYWKVENFTHQKPKLEWIPPQKLATLFYPNSHFKSSGPLRERHSTIVCAYNDSLMRKWWDIKIIESWSSCRTFSKVKLLNSNRRKTKWKINFHFLRFQIALMNSIRWTFNFELLLWLNEKKKMLKDAENLFHLLRYFWSRVNATHFR